MSAKSKKAAPKAAAKSAPKASVIAIARVLDDAASKPKVPKGPAPNSTPVEKTPETIKAAITEGKAKVDAVVAKRTAKPRDAASVAKSIDASRTTKREPKPLDAKVVELIALLKTKKGATNDEAAKALKLKSKGDAPHQSPSAQVRAMIRDKVRKLHTVNASEHDAERGGIVYTITK